MQVTASRPGSPVPKIDKRTGDNILCHIDCQSLLSDKELIYGNPAISTTDLFVENIRTTSGKFIQFRISGGPTKVPYTDYSIVFTVNTTMKNVLTVPITVRAYSN